MIFHISDQQIFSTSDLNSFSLAYNGHVLLYFFDTIVLQSHCGILYQKKSQNIYNEFLIIQILEALGGRILLYNYLKHVLACGEPFSHHKFFSGFQNIQGQSYVIFGEPRSLSSPLWSYLFIFGWTLHPHPSRYDVICGWLLGTLRERHYILSCAITQL